MNHKIAEVSTVHIDWHNRPKVYLRSTTKLIDFRRRHWQWLRQTLQENLDTLCSLARQIQENIESASYYLAKYQEWTNEAQALRAELQDYRKNPAKTWTQWESVQDSDTGVWEQRELTYHWTEDADIIIDEKITKFDGSASTIWSVYEEVLNEIISYAPQQRQEEFRRVASRQIEKLAKDVRWVERYETQLESTK